MHSVLRRQLTSAAIGKPLFASQHLLKKLPVPTLKQTLDKYLRSVRALATDEEYAQTEKFVREFGQPGGLGEVLQQRLLERNEQLPQGWLIDWWNNYAYFSYRDPIVINVSYFFQFAEDKNFPTQTSRAASLIQSALSFRDEVLNETLVPDANKEGPQDMSQFQYMFNSCRRPVPDVDVTNVHAAANNFIVVMRKNKFYKVPVQHPDGTRLSTKELTLQLQAIIDMAGTQNGVNVGILTTENRDTYAKAFAELIKSPLNQYSIDTIEKSILMMCLDDYNPKGDSDDKDDRNATDRALWHGDGNNRFWDKTLQFVVFPSGRAGFIGEHSMMDGTPTNRLTDTMLINLAKGSINHFDNRPMREMAVPQELKFELPTSFNQVLSDATTHFRTLVDAHDHFALRFHKYGKNQIKKFGFSPDAFVQMSIQLAYYKRYGLNRATYESAQTRKFLNGRTETNRSVSLESTAWVKKMCDPSATPKDKKELLKKAVDAQVAYMADAVNAQGVDRHLLGLKLLRRPNEKPEIFEDKLFKESGKWYLSTSQLSGEYYTGYGWGEVVPDGYGCAYMINNDSLNYNIACLKSFASAKTFAKLIEESLDEMAVVCQAVSAKL